MGGFKTKFRSRGGYVARISNLMNRDVACVILMWTSYIRTEDLPHLEQRTIVPSSRTSLYQVQFLTVLCYKFLIYAFI